MDTHWRLNFPNRHPLAVSDTDVVDDADCVLFVDVKDMVKPTHRTDRLARRVVSRLAPDCRVLAVGFGDVGISSWSEDYAQLIPAEETVVADTAVALPQLLELCRGWSPGSEPPRAAERADWLAALTALHDRTFAGWADRAARAATRPRWPPPSWPRRCGRSCASTTGCSPRAPPRSGRCGSGTSTPRTATPAGSWAPPPRSASRSASPSRTRAPAGWWWTCSPTAT